MRARRKQQPELRPIYVAPAFDARERAAKRDWCRAAYRGERHRPKPGEFDPLWLRLGLRMQLIESRAGWVVSNPLYDQSLRRSPASDPSLAGPGWLREVYRFHGHRGLVQLDRAREAIECWLTAKRAAEELFEAPAGQADAKHEPAQQQLFSVEASAC